MTKSEILKNVEIAYSTTPDSNHAYHTLAYLISSLQADIAKEAAGQKEGAASMGSAMQELVIANKGRLEYANPAKTLLDSMPEGSEVILRRIKGA